MIMWMSTIFWLWFHDFIISGILNVIDPLDMYANVTCFIHSIVKCSYIGQLIWNLVCWFLTCCMIFEAWLCIFSIFHFCFGHMNVWCDNVCHTIWCHTCAFSFLGQLSSVDSNFWHDDCVWHVVCTYKLSWVFDSFLF